MRNRHRSSVIRNTQQLAEMAFHMFAFTLAALLLAAQVSAQAPRPNGAETQTQVTTENNVVVQFESLEAVDPGTPAFMAKLEEECNREFRNIDGSCTNKANRLWGSANRPQLLPEGVSSKSFPETNLPSPRLVSNLICKQSKDKFSRRGLSEMVTIFGQFVDHNLIVSRSRSDSSTSLLESCWSARFVDRTEV